MCFSLDCGSWAVPPLPLLKFHQDLQYLRQPGKTPGEKCGKIYIIIMYIYYIYMYVYIYDMCDVVMSFSSYPEYQAVTNICGDCPIWLPTTQVL